MKILFSLLTSLLFVSCAGPGGGGGGSLQKSELGNRPGPRAFRTVVIDAGHGGQDSGARSGTTGDMEKTLVLDTARRLRAALAGDFRVVMLRDSDTFIDLDERVVQATRAGDVLVSLHFNHGPSHLRGPETYWWRVDSYSFARRMHEAMCAVSPAEQNRGFARRRLRLTRNPAIPCALVEVGYLSNPSDARLCATPAYRERMAQALAAAIRQQAACGDAGMGPLPRHIDAPPSRPTDAPE